MLTVCGARPRQRRSETRQLFSARGGVTSRSPARVPSAPRRRSAPLAWAPGPTTLRAGSKASLSRRRVDCFGPSSGRRSKFKQHSRDVDAPNWAIRPTALSLLVISARDWPLVVARDRRPPHGLPQRPTYHVTYDYPADFNGFGRSPAPRFQPPHRGRCPCDAPKSAESTGAGLAPRRGPGDELEPPKDLGWELLRSLGRVAEVDI